MSDLLFDLIGFICAAFGAVASAIGSLVLIVAVASGVLSGWFLLAAPVFVGSSVLGGYVAADLASDFIRDIRR